MKSIFEVRDDWLVVYQKGMNSTLNNSEQEIHGSAIRQLPLIESERYQTHKSGGTIGHEGVI
jgi:hypothetical protein